MSTQTLSLFSLGKSTKSRSISIGWIGLTIAIICGSTSTTFAKQLTSAFSPLSLLFVSESIVLLFTVLSFGIVPLIEELIKHRKKYFFPLFFVGITNSVIAPLLVFTGLHLSQAINAELYLRTYGIFLFIFASIFLKEKISRTDIFALTLTFSGVAIVAMQGFTSGLMPESGDLLVLAGAVTYAVGGVVFKKQLHVLHPELVLFVRGATAMIFFFLVSPFIETNFLVEIKAFPLVLLSALVGYGLISRFLYLFGYYESIERLPIHTVALFLPLMTVGSLFFSSIILKEAVLWYHIAGGAMIILGSVVMQFSLKHFKPKQLSWHLRHSNRHHV